MYILLIYGMIFFVVKAAKWTASSVGRATDS
ncbi:hypothetical protein LAA29_70033 [Leuconostoc carnosum]|nr:hypothetical protein LAA29_70033 [Leuconostoc carnosum]